MCSPIQFGKTDPRRPESAARSLVKVVVLALIVGLTSGACANAATTVVHTAVLVYDADDGRHTLQSNSAVTVVTQAQSITGRVKDELGMPVKSARVDAKQTSRASVVATGTGDTTFVASADAVVASAVTDADGAYALDGLAAGTYDLYISADGRITEVVPGIAVGPDIPLVTLETRVPAAKSWPHGLYMLALPFGFADADPAAVFGRASGLKLARWAPGQPGGYLYYARDSGFPPFAPGLGYWLQVGSGDVLTLQQPGTPTDESAPRIVPLSPGWNMVGNPFPATIEWASVQVRANGQTMSLDTAARNSWIRPYGWSYNPEGREYVLVDASYRGATTSLGVWQACWVRAMIACELVIPPPGAQTSAASATRSAAPAPEWSLQLVARVGDLRDSFNYLGVAADAAADSRLSLQSPPQLSPYVDLSFSDGRAADLATDFRSPVAGRVAWDFVVRSDLPRAQVELTWPDLSRVPSRYRVTLIDLDAQRRQYMRTTSSYVFNTGDAGGDRHFQIEVDPTPWARLQVGDLQQVVGRASGMTITYDLSSPAVVDIEVRTLAGQLVRVLARGASASAGTNMIGWDGTDSSGRMMPNGPYLCAISAMTEEGQAVKGMRTVILTR
jgi:hypothetical protein